MDGTSVRFQQMCGNSLINHCTNIFNVIDLFKKPGWNPYWKIKTQTNSTHETLYIECGDPTAQACYEKNSHKSCVQITLTGVGPEDKHRESGLWSNACQTYWTKATTINRWWWEKNFIPHRNIDLYTTLFTRNEIAFSFANPDCYILAHSI